MRSYTPSHPVRSAVVLAVALLALAGGISLHRAYTRVPVTVDGMRFEAGPGDTVESVAEKARRAPLEGDLVSATDGRVLAHGGGKPGEVWVNGTAAEPSARVVAGDDIRTRRGDDVTEPVVETTVTLPAPAVVTGDGPIIAVEDPGENGIQKRVVGQVSRSLVTSETVREPRPLRLHRRSVPTPERAAATGGKVVALTFDDGPWPEQTDRILQILEAERVPATFFMLGSYARRWPQVAARVAAAGHAVGTHTENHVPLTTLDGWRLHAEVGAGKGSVERTTGAEVRWFRPPGGKVDSEAYRELRAQGLRAVLWTVDPQDWRESASAEEIAASVTGAVHPGAIVLLHDGGGDQSATIEALPRIIRDLKAKGYVFVTIDGIRAPKSGWR
ncbi:MAG: polysaccharide deacetylase family protein [Anaerosomatales bacterium]|nr:polysaccharide deacetylase family protein [Anaerosomatales bacterium]